jgi:hypothetical protein
MAEGGALVVPRGACVSHPPVETPPPRLPNSLFECCRIAVAYSVVGMSSIVCMESFIDQCAAYVGSPKAGNDAAFLACTLTSFCPTNVPTSHSGHGVWHALPCR